MVKLIHKKKIILSDMVLAEGTFRIARGLMFAGKEKIKKGICLVLPVNRDVKFGASVTMWFCFYSMEILFINSKMQVVDKVVLKPWVSNYTPKKPCKYVVEGWFGDFKSVNVGEKVEFEN